jgi:hypothetical protein
MFMPPSLTLTHPRARQQRCDHPFVRSLLVAFTSLFLTSIAIAHPDKDTDPEGYSKWLTEMDYAGFMNSHRVACNSNGLAYEAIWAIAESKERQKKEAAAAAAAAAKKAAEASELVNEAEMAGYGRW